MKNKTALLLIWIFLLNMPMARTAEQNRSLAINRLMLARFQSEYARLKKTELETPSEKTKKEISDVEYKIQALNEEAQKLRSAAPENPQAGEFMSDLIKKKPAEKPLKKAAPARTTAWAEKMHETALDFVAKDKLEEAAKLYEEMVLADPNNDEAYLLMGHCYLLSGEYEKAESAFHNAAHINPENTLEIAPFYENMILQNGSDDASYAHLGYAYLILGDYQKAEEAFKNALNINPANEKALTGFQITRRQ